MASGAAMAAPLVMVGMGMMSGITQITWKHVEISLPRFLMIVGMPFTCSITTGVMLGIVSHVVVMACRGRAHLVDPALYLPAAVFVLNSALGALPQPSKPLPVGPQLSGSIMVLPNGGLPRKRGNPAAHGPTDAVEL